MAPTVVCYQNSLDKNRRGTSANLPYSDTTGLKTMVGSVARRVTATALSSRDEDDARIILKSLFVSHSGCGLRSYG
jgi:hypothetical protein